MSPRALVLLLMAIATAFAALNVGAGALYLVAEALFVFGLAAFGSAWRARSALEVEGALPVRAQAGASATIALEVRALRALPPLLSLVPDPGTFWRRIWLPRLHADGTSLPPLDRGARTQVSVACTWPRRGRHPLPSLALQAPAWGLGGWLHPVSVPGTTLVHPVVEPIGVAGSGRAAGDLRSMPRGSGAREARLAPSGELVRGVRTYRSGDSPRMVHARASARTGDLRVRETEGDEPGGGGWRVVLDGGLDGAAFERALEILASLAAWHARDGRKLAVWSPHGVWPGEATLTSALDWLAVIEWVASEPTRPDQWPWSPTALLTTRPDRPGETLWLHVGAASPPAGAIACGPGRSLEEALRVHLA